MNFIIFISFFIFFIPSNPEFLSSSSSSSSSSSYLPTNTITKSFILFPLRTSKRTSISPCRFSLKDHDHHETESSTRVSVAPEKPKTEEHSDSEKQQQQQEEQQHELDWKTDEEFKKFMGNPLIEAAIKLEKKRADRKPKLEVIPIGSLRRPIDEVIPKLEKKLSDAAGREVVVWFMEEKINDITKQKGDSWGTKNAIKPKKNSSKVVNDVLKNHPMRPGSSGHRGHKGAPSIDVLAPIPPLSGPGHRWQNTQSHHLQKQAPEGRRIESCAMCGKPLT